MRILPCSGRINTCILHLSGVSFLSPTNDSLDDIALQRNRLELIDIYLRDFLTNNALFNNLHKIILI
jgi:hypothetical protein